MENLVVTSSPFIHSSNDVNKMFLYTSMALMFPAIYGVMFFGMSCLIHLLVSVASCFLFEALFNVINKKKFFVDDVSFMVTGLILALTMPYKISYFIVIGCAFFAIFVVKMAFGGLGRNVVNPALAGRCLAGLISAGAASEFYQFTLNGETMLSLTQGGTNTISNLLVGEAVGGIGTTSVLILLGCYIFLVYAGVIDFKIPLLSILAYFVVGLTLNGLETNVLNMFSGSFIFVSVFMMTEPNISPNTFLGKVIYSLAFGALSAIVWNIGKLGENSVFVVALFVNMFVPIMDKYLVIKPWKLGGVRNAYKN